MSNQSPRSPVGRFRVVPRQVSLFDSGAAQAAKDEGMARALSTAKRREPAWPAYALACLEDLCRTQPTVHTDDLARACAWHPYTPNAWGGIWQRAIKRGWIARSGHTRPSKQRGKHGHEYPVYRSRLFVGGGR